MKLSPNQINRELQEIASAHLQVNSYHWGDLSDIQESQVIHYPLMNCYLQSGGNFNNNTTDVTIIVEIYDILYKDSDNLNDVESDTKQISRDIYQVLNKSTRWKRFGKVTNATNQKYKWLAHDEIAGWSQSVSFKLRDVSGVCDLPMQDYDFDQQPNNTSSCQSGAVTLDGAALVTVPSGGMVDVQLEDQNGATITPTSISGGVIEVDQTPPSENGTALLLKSGEVGDNVGRDGDVLTLGAPLLDSNGNYFLNSTLERFTDTVGTQVYADGIVVDRSTFDKNTGRVLCYNLDLYSETNDFFTAVASGAASTLGGFSGWQLSSKREQDNLDHCGVQGICNFAPWNLSPTGTKYFYSRTEYAGSTSLFWLSRENANDQIISKTTSSTSCRMMLTRIFTWNGTALT